MAKNGDMFKPVSSGERVDRSAAFHNATVQAILATRDGGVTGQGSASGRNMSGLVLVRNDTDVQVPRYGILGFDEPLILPEDNERRFLASHAFSGVVPTALHSRRFVVTQQPIAPGKVGLARYSGMTPVRLSKTTTSTTSAATVVVDSVANLKPGGGAAEIVWCETEDEQGEPIEGEVWAKVILGGAGGANFGLVTAPDCRSESSGDKPAWINASDRHVYVVPCDADGVPLDDEPPTSLTVATIADFVRVELDGKSQDPSLFDGDVIRYTVDGEKNYIVGDGWYDGRLGDTRRITNPSFGVAEGRGWFWSDDSSSHVMPCTDVDTLGASIANIDIRQSLDVEAGTRSGNDPHVHTQGDVTHAIYKVQTSPVWVEVDGNYARTLVRMN